MVFFPINGAASCRRHDGGCLAEEENSLFCEAEPTMQKWRRRPPRRLWLGRSHSALTTLPPAISDLFFASHRCSRFFRQYAPSSRTADMWERPSDQHGPRSPTIVTFAQKKWKNHGATGESRRAATGAQHRAAKTGTATESGRGGGLFFPPNQPTHPPLRVLTSSPFRSMRPVRRLPRIADRRARQHSSLHNCHRVEYRSPQPGGGSIDVTNREPSCQSHAFYLTYFSNKH